MLRNEIIHNECYKHNKTNMIFIYPYKRKDSDFLISHSVKCVMKAYPNARCITVGDEVEGIENIPHKDSNVHKGANVTAKILYAAQFFEEFIYMNDDFFINEEYQFNVFNCGVEPLERKDGKASISWNTATDNTKHWLEHNNYPVWSYECHQPVKMNAELLFRTFERVDWKSNEHFIKSIYCNVNLTKYVELIPNLKKPKNVEQAKEYLNEYGCFSVQQSFMTKRGAEFIKELSK